MAAMVASGSASEAEAAAQPVVLARDQRAQDVVLVREVGVERAAGEPGPGADVLHRAAEHAPLREHVPGRIQDALPGGLATA
jgi:hypothetical protein